MAKFQVRLQEEKQKQETANVFRAKFLHEIAMLRQRLQECSLDVLAREEDKDGSARTTDACDFISTSDSRIGLLLAEVIWNGKYTFEIRNYDSDGSRMTSKRFEFLGVMFILQAIMSRLYLD